MSPENVAKVARELAAERLGGPVRFVGIGPESEVSAEWPRVCVRVVPEEGGRCAVFELIEDADAPQ